MGYCEELIIAGPVSGQNYDSAGMPTGQPIDGGYWFFMSEHALELLDKCVNVYGDTGEGWKFKIQHAVTSFGELPWAIIFLDREYQLAGHFMELKEGSIDLKFTWYSVGSADLSNHLDRRISVIFVMNKSALMFFGEKSQLLSGAFDLLKDKTENKHWLCIPEPLPQDWAAKNERLDLDILKSQLDKGSHSQVVGG